MFKTSGWHNHQKKKVRNVYSNRLYRKKQRNGFNNKMHNKLGIHRQGSCGHWNHYGRMMDISLNHRNTGSRCSFIIQLLIAKQTCNWYFVESSSEMYKPGSQSNGSVRACACVHVACLCPRFIRELAAVQVFKSLKPNISCPAPCLCVCSKHGFILALASFVSA